MWSQSALVIVLLSTAGASAASVRGIEVRSCKFCSFACHYICCLFNLHLLVQKEPNLNLHKEKSSLRRSLLGPHSLVPSLEKTQQKVYLPLLFVLNFHVYLAYFAQTSFLLPRVRRNRTQLTRYVGLSVRIRRPFVILLANLTARGTLSMSRLISLTELCLPMKNMAMLLP